MDDRPHDRRRYWRGCRCKQCTTDTAAYSRAVWAARRIRRGANPASYEPARSTRRRITQLQAAGLTMRDIANAAGVSVATVCRCAHLPDNGNVSRLTARAVAQVDP